MYSAAARTPIGYWDGWARARAARPQTCPVCAGRRVAEPARGRESACGGPAAQRPRTPESAHTHAFSSEPSSHSDLTLSGRLLSLMPTRLPRGGECAHGRGPEPARGARWGWSEPA
eukprot:scaffold760_cov372-Prasinococcus_capsulatus_cf.AAC.1